MKKKLALILAGTAMAAMVLAGCGEKNNASGEDVKTAESVEDKKTFTVGFDAEYPPYGYMDENGEYTGFDLELAEAVCKEEGGQKKLADTFGALNEFADYNTAFTELQAGALDALAIDVGVANYQIKSRGEGYKILDETLNTEQYAIGFKKGNQELCDVVNADLKKLTEDGTVAKLAEKYEIADMVTLK